MTPCRRPAKPDGGAARSSPAVDIGLWDWAISLDCYCVIAEGRWCGSRRSVCRLHQLVSTRASASGIHRGMTDSLMRERKWPSQAFASEGVLIGVDAPACVVNNAWSMSQKLAGKRLAVLGTGKLGGILLRAYLKQGLFDAGRVTATVKHAEKAASLAKELGVSVTTDNRKAVHGADIVLLGEKTLVISVAASVPTSYIEQHIGGTVPVIRAMPNTPCAVGCGMTGICRGAHAAAQHLEIARTMFDAVGRTVVVDEKNMDVVTGLSASGPAFAYIILESLAEAGVKVGLARDVSTLLAAQTMKGAASVVLETGDRPALLKDAVTMPAGCTIDGIMELEEGKLRVTLIKAVVKATSRAGELLFEK